jgi:hypothetical protein
LEDRRLLTVITPTTFGDTNTTFTGVPATSAISVPTLRDAVIEANYLGGTNTIKLSAGIYTLSIPNSTVGGYETGSHTGDLNINSNLTIQGVGVGPLPLTIIRQTAVDRVFAVNAIGGPALTVNFNDLVITGGKAVDDAVAGTLPGTSNAEGGGIWASGDNALSLSTVIFQGDSAVAGTGDGDYYAESAYGGGMYDFAGLSHGTRTTTKAAASLSTSGTLSLTNVTFLDNSAIGGTGNAALEENSGGYAYGGGLYTYEVAVTLGGASPVSTVAFIGNQAVGGPGSTYVDYYDYGYGYGGGAGGGGMYADVGTTLSEAGATVGLSVADFVGNKAVGGLGAHGGNGTYTGGSGGDGGYGAGGGLYASGATITLRGGYFLSNLAQGGNGGAGGSATGYAYSEAGDAGDGGNGDGGAVYQYGDESPAGTLSLTQVLISLNKAQGGAGGAGGSAGSDFSDSAGGTGGYGEGGGLSLEYYSTTTLNQVTISLNTAQGAPGGAGGSGSSAPGGEGGEGGWAYGGGIEAYYLGTLNVNGGTVTGNQALASNGAVGGSGKTTGPGGPGGWSQGGGIWAGAYDSDEAETVNLAGPIVSVNLAQGGNGGPGASNTSTSNANTEYSQPGGGGFAQGGGIFLEEAVETATNSFTVLTNKALGGNGGVGVASVNAGIAGVGGQADGGGLFTYDSTYSVSRSYVELNIVQGGKGGASGARGSGAGGSGIGGGVYLDGGSLTLTSTWIMVNIAYAGTSSLGGGSGSALGGGIYEVTGSTLTETTTFVLANLPDNFDTGAA